MISNANPKIASYHFTTLSPNLGVVSTKDYNYVVADLPGLIEGASQGQGLGHKFLKHIERTKVIAHIIDMSGSEGRNPYDDYLVIRKELAEFSPKLIEKPEIIIANKMDLEDSSKNIQEFRKKVSTPILEISAINNQGLDVVINELKEQVKSIPDSSLFTEEFQEKHILYKFKKEKPYHITKEQGAYIISGAEVEKIFKMINFNTEEAVSRFSKKLRRMGVDEDLEKMGIQEGDLVKILDYEFEYTK
jgi:GTP-binding protein